MQRKVEADAWQRVFDSYLTVVKNDYGDYSLDDFRYTFSGDTNSGQVVIIFKGETSSDGFEVVKEGDQWKINER